MNNRPNNSKRGIVRLIYGEDGFRAHERLKFYTGAFRKQHDPNDLSVARFVAPNFKIEDLYSSLGTPPLFAPKRLFVIYNFSKLKLDKDNETLIFKSVENLKDNSIIFLEEFDEKIFKKNSFYKKIKLSSVERFPRLKGFYLEKEINKRFEKQGYKIEPTALKKFLLLVGGDFWKINSEIEKLLHYVDSLKRKAVSLKDVEAVTLPDLANNCFAFLDYLNQKDKKNTIQELQNLRYSGIGEENIFYQIISNFRILLEVRVLMDEKNSDSNAIAASLNIHPYRAQILYQAAKNFTSDELKNIHNSLTDTDFKIKTGKLKSSVALDLLITNLLI